MISYIYFFFETLPFLTLCSGVLPLVAARFGVFFFFVFGRTKSSESSSPPYLDIKWSKKLLLDAARSDARFMICLAKSFSCDFASNCFLISRASSASRAYFLWRRFRFAFGSSVNALNSGTSPDAIHSVWNNEIGLFRLNNRRVKSIANIYLWRFPWFVVHLRQP